MRHGTCFRRHLAARHARAAPHSAVAELGVVRSSIHMQKLIEVLVREGTTLGTEFAAASALGEGTSQEVAEFRENALRSFVERFYPSPYHVVKGKVHDSFGTDASASIDCLVVNPVNPNLIDSHGKFQLLLADGVDLAMELKPDLASRAELHRGLEQGMSIKKLRRARVLSFLRARLPLRTWKKASAFLT